MSGVTRIFSVAALATALATALAMALALATSAPARAQASAAGHHADVRGIRMYYELHGTGPPLLLLHGGGGNGMQFDKQLPAFAPTHRLIVPDACAQGRTTDRPGPLSYHAMAEDMLALLDLLKIRHVDIMGWSDGGNIGLDLAMHHPDRVRRLVTFGANFRPDGLNPDDVAWNNKATAESFGDGMREAWTRLNPQPQHYAQAMNKLIAMWRTQPNWTAADLGRIRARCLICAGEHDVVRPEHTQALAAAIRGATLWLVPNASHGAMSERADIVNPRVLEFLSQ